METMDAYTLMNTKIMDRIMKELWDSEYDMSGSFLDQSTSYQLLQSPDEEIDRRFFKHRDLKRTRQHKYILPIWTESI
jgi:hypothetical protein